MKSIVQKFITPTAMATLFLSSFPCWGQEVLQFPEVGPIVRSISTNDVVIMGQGNKHHEVTGVYRYAKVGPDEAFSAPHIFSMSKADYNVAHAAIKNLDADSLYKVQIGYVNDKSALDKMDWSQAHNLSVMMQSSPKGNEFSIQVGSCRRLGEILGVSIWSKEGDKIFKAMLKDLQVAKSSGVTTDLITLIGDQIYSDATAIGSCKTAQEYAERYELAFSQKYIRALMASGIPVYMTRDDHEWWNNANKEEQELRPEQNQAAKLSYDLFQRPLGKETPNWWYTVSGNVEIFYTDTRSEREPSKQQIISPEQLTALKEWLGRDDLKDRIKIIVSSVPMFLLDTNDSWGGYKAQLADLLSYITTKEIKYAMVLSGDAHCENEALFKITTSKGEEKGHILEVLVSGLYAVARNKAGKIAGAMDLSEHGFKVESKTPLHPTLTENLFARITGDHKLKTVNVAVYNNKHNLLQSSVYNLETGNSKTEAGIQ